MSDEPEVREYYDPLEALLGPGNKAKIAGEPDDTIPQEVLDYLTSSGIGKRVFRVLLKQTPVGGITGEPSATKVQIKSFYQTIPSVDYIGRNYGPGEYELLFIWQAKNEEGKVKNNTESIPVVVSDHYEIVYREYQYKLRIESMSRQKEMMKAAKVANVLDKELDGFLNDTPKQENVDPKKAAQDYIKETLESAKMLGLNPTGNVQKEFPLKEILSLALPMLPVVMNMIGESSRRRQEQADKNLAMMMSMMTNSSNQMVEILKTQSGSGAGANAVKEYKEMVLGALDLKSAINGEPKQTIIDKLFDMVMGVAPQILSVMQLNAQQRATNPMLQMGKQFIKSMPEVDEIKKDPISTIAMIKRLDASIGWEQTNFLLTEAMGIERPQECPCLINQRYKCDDPRNNPTETESEVVEEEAFPQ